MIWAGSVFGDVSRSFEEFRDLPLEAPNRCLSRAAALGPTGYCYSGLVLIRPSAFCQSLHHFGQQFIVCRVADVGRQLWSHRGDRGPCGVISSKPIEQIVLADPRSACIGGQMMHDGLAVGVDAALVLRSGPHVHADHAIIGHQQHRVGGCARPHLAGTARGAEDPLRAPYTAADALPNEGRCLFRREPPIVLRHCRHRAPLRIARGKLLAVKQQRRLAGRPRAMESDPIRESLGSASICHSQAFPHPRSAVARARSAASMPL
ncbi:hypothetical protein SAMN05216338_104965 [Bradyrhizobium sp. Rc2d]|nr:hypothetical protein SAMN05216338_104965 [Bradyrhizobium sp. Rc2d]